MPTRLARPGEVDGDAFDVYTLVHMAIGSWYGVAGAPWWAALGLATGWELVERQLKEALPEVFSPHWSPIATQDRLPNAVVDIAAVMAGWGLVTYLRRRA